MGPGDGATKRDTENAYTLGQLIAEQNWILLTGGRNVGVMDAASRGAKSSGGVTVGILPSDNKNGMSDFIDIPICTGMGGARNNINVLSSDVVVACGTGTGTISEIMLALKANKPVFLINTSKNLKKLLDEMPYPKPNITPSPPDAIDLIRQII